MNVGQSWSTFIAFQGKLHYQDFTCTFDIGKTFNLKKRIITPWRIRTTFSNGKKIFQTQTTYKFVPPHVIGFESFREQK